MKEYGCCPKFRKGNNLTYTLKYVLYGGKMNGYGVMSRRQHPISKIN
jgi:hypothetical protein